MKIVNHDARAFRSSAEALAWLVKNDSERRVCLTMLSSHDVKINLVGRAKDLADEISRISDVSVKELIGLSSVTRTYFLAEVGKTDYVYSILGEKQ